MKIIIDPPTCRMAVMVICFFLSKFSFSQDVAGTWSGTISMEINQTNILGTYHVLVSLSVVDNQVKGTTTSEKKVMVEGKQVGEEICSGGIGPGILWRVAFSDDGTTYDVEATAPNFECTSKNFLTGHTEMGTQDGHHIVALENRLTGNKNLLSGSKTETSDMGGIGTSTTTVRWRLSRSSGIDLIVFPTDYDNWLPVPGKNELTPGSMLSVRLKLMNANGTTPSIKAKKFILELTNTSNEPGITINAPHQPLYPNLYDLRFILQSKAILSADFQSIEINCAGCTGSSVQIGSFDGGGWTTLTAKAILEDNTEVEGKLLTNNGPTEILIPKRDPTSHIALKWLNANGNPANEQDDKERSKNNTNDGDGLSVYEEYRGVLAKGGVFKRLDPQKKELGVWMKSAEDQLFEKGIQLFEKASDINVIRFLDNDITWDRILNRNFATAHVYDQQVLNLFKGPLPIGEMGSTAGLGIIDAMFIMIDVDKHARHHKDPVVNEVNLSATVAHEIGHGVGIDHHGPPSPDRDIYVFKNRIVKGGQVFSVQPGWIIIDRNNIVINVRPQELTGPDGITHNEASGDTSCIMRYNYAYAWSLNEQHGPMTCRAQIRQPTGKTFCVSKKGTGLNADHYNFDDATKGECIKQINLK